MRDKLDNKLEVGDRIIVNGHGNSVILAYVLKLNPRTLQYHYRKDPPSRSAGWRKDYCNVIKYFGPEI